MTDNEPLSIILYNIPSGCDYDLYLFNSDQSGWYTDFQEGSAELNRKFVYIMAP